MPFSEPGLDAETRDLTERQSPDGVWSSGVTEPTADTPAPAPGDSAARAPQIDPRAPGAPRSAGSVPISVGTPRIAFPPATGESAGIAGAVPTVGLHEDEESVVSALVSRARIVTGMDVASAAVRDAGGGFPMSVYRGVRSDAYRALTIRPGAGLGGLVLQSGQPVRLPDYQHSALITPDYRAAVDVEGLHGIVCVPVAGPDGVSALLYAAVRESGIPGDIAVVRLEGLATEAATALHHLAARAAGLELANLRQRQAIAGRLHDSIAQTLFSIGLLAHRGRGAADPAVQASSLTEIETVTRAARSELRATLADLCRVPDGRGLDLALVAESPDVHRGQRRRRSGGVIGANRAGVAPEVTELVIDGLREGLRNAVKHAGAEQVMATVRWGRRRGGTGVADAVGRGGGAPVGPGRPVTDDDLVARFRPRHAGRPGGGVGWPAGADDRSRSRRPGRAATDPAGTGYDA